MIARIWRGCTPPENADSYKDFVTAKVFSELGAIPGHRNAFLLRRQAEGETEFLAVTLWESRQSIEGFAGKDIDRAVVEPEARALLSHFDDFVRHYEVVSGVAACAAGKEKP